MSRVAIIGAGDMGTALVTPLARNGHDVRLWGTELDGDIVAALGGGGRHPRLGVALPDGARVFAEPTAGEALAGAEIVVVAVTSSVVARIVGRLAPLLAAAEVVVTVAKGFDRDATGAIRILPDIIAAEYPGPVVAVGGPSKANEVALGEPTAVVFAGQSATAVDRCQEIFATDRYAVGTNDDVIGVEVAAAMKNAYAIALGIADGLERRTGHPHHNLKAALFPRAVREMVTLATALGGRAETVLDLAGTGDLQVTITSGRNRLLGERIGQGEPAATAARDLAAGGTTIEGHAAVGFGAELVLDHGIAADLPLLMALWRILDGVADPLNALWAAVRPDL